MALRTGSERGFTLLEVLVVLAIVAVATLIVAPRFVVREGPSLREAARASAVELRRVRDAAVARRRIEPVDPVLVRARTGFRGSVAIPGEGLLLFFPDGGSTGGALVLEDRGERMAVTVDWLTGQVALRDG